MLSPNALKLKGLSLFAHVVSLCDFTPSLLLPLYLIRAEAREAKFGNKL